MRKSKKDFSLESIQNDIKEIEKGINYKYKTNGQLSGIGNIKNSRDIEVLIKAHSSIVNLECDYFNSTKILGLKEFPTMTIGGHTADDWISDIRMSVELGQKEELLKELKGIESQYLETISKEEKRSDAMARYSKLKKTKSLK